MTNDQLCFYLRQGRQVNGTCFDARLQGRVTQKWGARRIFIMHVQCRLQGRVTQNWGARPSTIFTSISFSVLSTQVYRDRALLFVAYVSLLDKRAKTR